MPEVNSSNGKAPKGSGIVHPTRPSIKHLLGKEVTVTHHDAEKHGTWEGTLEGYYLGGVEEADHFVFMVQGTPCDYCGQRCTDGEGQGCDEWNSIPEVERYPHSSQPTLQFTPHAVYSKSGTVIILG